MKKISDGNWAQQIGLFLLFYPVLQTPEKHYPRNVPVVLGTTLEFLLFKKNLFYFWLCWVFTVVQGLLIAVVSLVVEPRLQCTGSVVVTHGLSCSEVSGIFPDRQLKLSSALAGGFSTTGPPEKSKSSLLETHVSHCFQDPTFPTLSLTCCSFSAPSSGS